MSNYQPLRGYENLKFSRPCTILHDRSPLILYNTAWPQSTNPVQYCMTAVHWSCTILHDRSPPILYNTAWPQSTDPVQETMELSQRQQIVLKLAELCILKGGGYREQCSVTQLKIDVLWYHLFITDLLLPKCNITMHININVSVTELKFEMFLLWCYVTCTVLPVLYIQQGKT